MTWWFSTRASVAVVLIIHTCISKCIWVNCLFYVLNYLEETFKIYLHLSSFLYTKLMQVVDILPHGILLDSQYHGCWWPGNVRNQAISSHVIDRPSSFRIFFPQHQNVEHIKAERHIYASVNYHKISNISCTKSHNLNDSHLALQLSLPNPLKPGVKSRMKM